MRRLRLLACCALVAGSAAAEEVSDEDAFVAANLRAILYHELGHAVIDLAELPIFGQEEDAADVASILLIDALFDDESAVAIAYDSAFGYLAEAEERDETGEDVPWWDVHGPDLQRYYTLVCLFAGADLEAREDVAEDLGLPQERLETCQEEFELASDSWGPVFADLSADAPGQSLAYQGGTSSFTEVLISEEVAALNLDFVLPERLNITVDSCGEANAFYDPETVEIIICTEFEDWLRAAAVRVID